VAISCILILLAISVLVFFDSIHKYVEAMIAKKLAAIAIWPH